MIFFYFECAFKKTYLTQIWTEQKNKIESIKKNNKLIGSSSPSDESLPNSLYTTNLQYNYKDMVMNTFSHFISFNSY